MRGLMLRDRTNRHGHTLRVDENLIDFLLVQEREVNTFMFHTPFDSYETS